MKSSTNNIVGLTFTKVADKREPPPHADFLEPPRPFIGPKLGDTSKNKGNIPKGRHWPCGTFTSHEPGPLSGT